MTILQMKAIDGSAPRAGAKAALNVPRDSQEFERAGLAAAAGKFLADGLTVKVAVLDGDVVAAEVEAIARKVEALLLSNPGARWRFHSVDPDDCLPALLEPTEPALAPAFVVQLLDYDPEVRLEAGMLPRSEWRAIAREDGVPEAVAASRKARANPTHHFFPISPTPALDIPTLWAVMMLDADATAEDLPDFEKRVAFYLERDITVRAYIPIGMRGTERFEQRCQALEKTARAEAKRGDQSALKAAALRVLEMRRRGPPEDEGSN